MKSGIFMIDSIFVSNATIENISSTRNTWLVTISYSSCPNCRNQNQQVVLVVDRNTLIQNERGAIISPRELTTGMIVFIVIGVLLGVAVIVVGIVFCVLSFKDIRHKSEFKKF